jgi:hypothetical protein
MIMIEDMSVRLGMAAAPAGAHAEGSRAGAVIYRAGWTQRKAAWAVLRP